MRIRRRPLLASPPSSSSDPSESHLQQPPLFPNGWRSREEPKQEEEKNIKREEGLHRRPDGDPLPIDIHRPNPKLFQVVQRDHEEEDDKEEAWEMPQVNGNNRRNRSSSGAGISDESGVAAGRKERKSKAKANAATALKLSNGAKKWEEDDDDEGLVKEEEEDQEDRVVHGGNAKMKRKSPAVLMEGSRCSRVNGRGWRCCQQTLVGYSLCEHHLGKGRLRSMSSVRGQLGSSKPSSSADDADGLAVQSSSPEKPMLQEHCFDVNNRDQGEEKPAKKCRRIGAVKARSISSLLVSSNTSMAAVLPPLPVSGTPPPAVVPSANGCKPMV